MCREAVGEVERKKDSKLSGVEDVRFYITFYQHVLTVHNSELHCTATFSYIHKRSSL